MTPISKELYAVLVAWREDAMSAEPSHKTRSAGLCRHATYHSLRLRDELHVVLIAEFGSYQFPFNGSHQAYWTDFNKHLNPRRRAWVDAKIAEYEAAHTGEVAGS